MKLSGCYTAITTPFDGDRIDTRAMAEHATWMVDRGVSGVVVAGTTGEAVTLTDDERIEAINAVWEAIGHRATVVAGVGNNDTLDSIQCMRRVNREARAHASMVVVPYYNKPPQEGMIAHFRAMADVSDVPMIVYNVPSRTAASLTVDSMAALAEHPNICGFKEATADMYFDAQLISRIAGRKSVLSGDDASAMPFVAIGGDGVISVAANIAPGIMSELCSATAAGDLTRARALNAIVARLQALLFQVSSPIPVKEAVAWLGFGAPTFRLPLVRMDPVLRDRLFADLAALGVHR